MSNGIQWALSALTGGKLAQRRLATRAAGATGGRASLMNFASKVAGAKLGTVLKRGGLYGGLYGGVSGALSDEGSILGGAMGGALMGMGIAAGLKAGVNVYGRRLPRTIRYNTMHKSRRAARNIGVGNSTKMSPSLPFMDPRDLLRIGPTFDPRMGSTGRFRHKGKLVPTPRYTSQGIQFPGMNIQQRLDTGYRAARSYNLAERGVPESVSQFFGMKRGQLVVR